MRDIQQYVIPPPDVPLYLYKNRPEMTLPQLIRWAEAEFQSRLVYLAEHGYWRELKVMNEQWSPIRILAEMRGFRRICAFLVNNADGWNRMSTVDRRFITRAFELRDLLLR